MVMRLGETVKLGYVDQSRDALDDSKTVWEEISDGLDELQLGNRTMPSRAYVSLFNFKGGEQQKRVGQLSGGERNRVHLAKMLKSGANVLLLDEPTNDLDVDTLRALEEALLEYPGCAVVISHDRWFLDRIATHILAFEGNSHVEWFEGNYQAYEEDKKRRLGAEASQPPVSVTSRFYAEKYRLFCCQKRRAKTYWMADVLVVPKRLRIASISALKSPPLRLISAVFSSCWVFSMEIFSISRSMI